jgi:hypothetical protein
MREPKRNNDINSLADFVRDRVALVIAELQRLGYDPVTFEAARSQQRQNWLFGIGRTHHKWLKPVTWTHSSKHTVGKAVDIISKSYGWDSPAFYSALARCAARHGLCSISREQCHIEWSGQQDSTEPPA